MADLECPYCGVSNSSIWQDFFQQQLKIWEWRREYAVLTVNQEKEVMEQIAFCQNKLKELKLWTALLA